LKNRKGDPAIEEGTIRIAVKDDCWRPKKSLQPFNETKMWRERGIIKKGFFSSFIFPADDTCLLQNLKSSFGKIRAKK